MLDVLDSHRNWPGAAGSPLLVLCDLCAAPPSTLSASPDFIENLTAVVERARRRGVAIAYCEKVGFDSRGWPDQLRSCRPKPPDRVFVRSAASCFSSQEFMAAAAEYSESGLFIAGFDIVRGVLATAIDADALGVKIGVLTDLCGDAEASVQYSGHAFLAAAIIFHWFAVDQHSDALFLA